MNKRKSNKIKEKSNTVRHLIMGQIITTQNLVAIKEVRHAGQQEQNFKSFVSMFMDSTNKRVDEFMVKTTSDLTSLRDSLEFSQAELAKISQETRIALSRPAATQDFDI